MSYQLWIFIIFLCITYYSLQANYLQSSIVKSYDEKQNIMNFYLLYYDRKSVYEIPDNTTLSAVAQELMIKINEIQEVPRVFIPGTMKPKDKTPSILTSNNSRIILAEILERSNFFKDSTLTPIPLWNPSIVYFQNRFLLCWRDGGKVAFGWLSADGKSMDTKSYLGIGGNDGIKHPINSGPSIEQEDPRLFVLSNNKLIVSFTGFFPDPKRPHVRIGKNIQCFITAEYSSMKQKLIFESNITQFDQQFDSPRQKNWVPFEYENTLHFIQNIQKMRVFKSLPRDSISLTNTGNYQEVSNQHIPKIPWKGRIFGGHLRGGTPAILTTLNRTTTEKVYLMLFHTSFSHRFSEYFMGAMTFCPKPPFHLHGISPLPILRTEKFYTGDFINGFLHYVVYPSGLIVDSRDPTGDTLLVSFGHQDKQGYLVSMNKPELIQSLSIQGKCE